MNPDNSVQTIRPGATGGVGYGRLLERFEVAEVLKDGQGIRTLLATDSATGAPVVVKTASLSSMAAGARMRLEHEAEVLADLRSDHVAPLLGFESAGDDAYLVLPYIDGETLEARLRRGPASVADSLTIARGILAGLAEAHRHGVLHRDVKPANVMVRGGSAIEQVTLIDFGLARSTRLHSSVRDIPVGTARYASPEQAGLLDRDPDERSDLYSTGVLLFECLTGRPPFEGSSVGEVLRHHLSSNPPEIRSMGISVPRALDEVVQRLLKKEPKDRYQSALSVLGDIDEIAAALEAGVGDPTVVVGLRDRRRELTEPAFVGRDKELTSLERELARARKGQGGLVVVEAESGGGKTRLLDELTQRASAAGMWVLRGQEVDQAARRPLQVMAGIAEGVVAAAAEQAEIGRAVADGLGELAPAVADALPELRPILGQTAQRTGPESYGEMRTLAGLVRLLDTVGSPERPALVVLEDCQWADGLTARLVAQWRSGGARGKRHVVVVVAFRSEEGC